MRIRLIIATMLLAAPTFAVEAVRLMPGQTTMITLPENPSTGFSWRAEIIGNAAEISDAGYQPGPATPGAPGKHSWMIRALRTGRATAAFDYQRPWEKKRPAETRRYEIVVVP